MDIRIKATDYEMTSEASAYLDERTAAIEKMLGGDAHAARLEVELGRAAGRPRHGDHLYFAEMHLRYPGGGEVRATNNEPTINAAIDNAKEELLRQLRKERKGSMRTIRKTGAAIKRWMRFGSGE